MSRKNFFKFLTLNSNHSSFLFLLIKSFIYFRLHFNHILIVYLENELKNLKIIKKYKRKISISNMIYLSIIFIFVFKFQVHDFISFVPCKQGKTRYLEWKINSISINFKINKYSLLYTF